MDRNIKYNKFNNQQNHHNNYNNYNNYNNNNNNYNNNYNKKPRVNTDYDNNYSNDNFEDNININIKNAVLDYLYNKIEVNDHKYTIIKNIGDIYDIKHRKFYVSANSCGINAILIFMKKELKGLQLGEYEYYSYLVDRRSISYNKNTLKKESVRFTEIKLSVDIKFYDGTIIDGILIDNDNGRLAKGDINTNNNNNNNNNNKMMFMATDVFTLCGKSMITLDYKRKMYTFMNIFTELIETNPNPNSTSNIELFVNKPYEINQMSNLFSEYIDQNHKKFNIKGITFYPDQSGTKLIYIFDKQDDKIKSELLDGNAKIFENVDPDDNLHLVENSENKKIFKFELMNPECIDDIVLNLQMVKTNISDVYKLYGIFNHKTKNDNKFIKKRIGIAYIPTYVLSLKCKNIFMGYSSKIIQCIFNSYKGQFIPIDEASVQKIDIINNDKRLKITEEEIVDNENQQDDVN